MVRKIAVLTSGGDAPGMNAAVRSVVRAGIKNGLTMYAVYDGYKGLCLGKIEEVDRNFVSDIINRGGTILHSARLPEFKDPEIQEMLSKYDYIYALYGSNVEMNLDDFLNRGQTSNVNRKILKLSEIQNSTWIIAVVSLIGLTSVGAYFFYRKRKEE